MKLATVSVCDRFKAFQNAEWDAPVAPCEPTCYGSTTVTSGT
jgi:hypothetical protein